MEEFKQLAEEISSPLKEKIHYYSPKRKSSGANTGDENLLYLTFNRKYQTIPNIYSSICMYCFKDTIDFWHEIRT